MTFHETPVHGAWRIVPSARQDERGFFARVWDRDAFAAHGLSTDFVQANNSASRRRGTVRGLHWQVAPAEEAKLVRCLRGRVFDVVADTRPESPTYLAWAGVELDPDARECLYIPRGCAHGYLALEDDSEVFYAVTAAYAPGTERGVRWDDPAFAIAWPDTGAIVLSDKDRTWPDYVAVTPAGTPRR